MAWIESHQELGRHPKTRKAARRLDVSVPQMMGHLHLLWHWALDYADTGDLTGHDDEDIALGAMWEGEPDEFVRVLTEVGFLDEDRTLHDWMDYAGRLVRDRIRKREERASANEGPSTDSPRTDVGQSVDRARARTLPNPTEPDPTPPTEERFAAFGDAYPRKDGMKYGGTSLGQVRKSWQKLSDEQQQLALVGVKHYAEYVGQPGAPIVAMATTWLNQERWELFQEPVHVKPRDGPKGPTRPPEGDVDYTAGWGAA